MHHRENILTPIPNDVRDECDERQTFPQQSITIRQMTLCLPTGLVGSSDK